MNIRKIFPLPPSLATVLATRMTFTAPYFSHSLFKISFSRGNNFIFLIAVWFHHALSNNRMFPVKGSSKKRTYYSILVFLIIPTYTFTFFTFMFSMLSVCLSYPMRIMLTPISAIWFQLLFHLLHMLFHLNIMLLH